MPSTEGAFTVDLLSRVYLVGNSGLLALLALITANPRPVLGKQLHILSRNKTSGNNFKMPALRWGLKSTYRPKRHLQDAVGLVIYLAPM